MDWQDLHFFRPCPVWFPVCRGQGAWRGPRHGEPPDYSP
jgi:hypothetical protein